MEPGIGSRWINIFTAKEAIVCCCYHDCNESIFVSYSYVLESTSYQLYLSEFLDNFYSCKLYAKCFTCEKVYKIHGATKC